MNNFAKNRRALTEKAQSTRSKSTVRINKSQKLLRLSEK